MANAAFLNYEEEMNINKTSKKLNTRIDNYIGVVPNNVLNELQKEIKKALLCSDYESIKDELILVENELNDYIFYYISINKVKYVRKNLTAYANILELVKIMTDVTPLLKASKLFYKEEQREDFDMFYKVMYELIKLEILENGHSLILNSVSPLSSDVTHLSKYIMDDINEIDKSAYQNIDFINLLYREINKLENRDKLVSERIIKIILYITKTDEYKRVLEEKVSEQKKQIEKDQKKLKNDIDLNSLINMSIDNEKKIRLIKEKTKEIEKCIVGMITAITIILSNVGIQEFFNKKNYEYKTYNTIYSSLTGLKESESEEKKLKDALRYSYVLDGIEKEFDVKRTLDVYSKSYYNELGDLVRDYKSYDISDKTFNTSFSNYASIDESDLQDRLIEEGTKEIDALYTLEETVVTEKKQDMKDVSYPSGVSFSRNTSKSIIIAESACLIGYIVITIIKLKERKNLRVLSKNLEEKINKIINECSLILRSGQRDIGEYKILAKELGEVSMLMGLTEEKETLDKSIKEIEDNDYEIRRKLHIDYRGE